MMTGSCECEERAFVLRAVPESPRGRLMLTPAWPVGELSVPITSGGLPAFAALRERFDGDADLLSPKR
jgi:hypothetical protein